MKDTYAQTIAPFGKEVTVFFSNSNLQGFPWSQLDSFEMCSPQLGDTEDWGLTAAREFQRVGEGLKAALVSELGEVLAVLGEAFSPRV